MNEWVVLNVLINLLVNMFSVSVFFIVGVKVIN